MSNLNDTVRTFIDGAGWMAPFLFVLLHLIRPFLLLPVVIVCVIGGVLFGIFWGSVLNLIGLSLMALITYGLIEHFPWFEKRLDRLKEKFIHHRSISLGRIMVLRCMPFVHFYLLTVYVIEMTKSFRSYAFYSVIGLIGPSILYTAFGHLIADVSIVTMTIAFTVLGLVYYGIHRFQKSRLPDDPEPQ